MAMINIYQKIRIQLAAEDKVGKYVKYDIGLNISCFIRTTCCPEHSEGQQTTNKND